MMIQRNGPNASFAAHDFLQSSTVFSSTFIAEASHLSFDVFRLILARQASIANQALLLLRQSNSTQFSETHSCIPLSLFRHIPSGTQKKENRHRKQRANANRFPMPVIGESRRPGQYSSCAMFTLEIFYHPHPANARHPPPGRYCMAFRPYWTAGYAGRNHTGKVAGCSLASPVGSTSDEADERHWSAASPRGAGAGGAPDQLPLPSAPLVST